MKKESLVKIGYVMKTHGLKGEITLKLNADAPDLSVGEAVMIEMDSGHVPYFVEKISYKHDQAFLKLEEVQNIEQSGKLKGRSIFIDKSKRPKLKRGEYYDDELVGFEVYNHSESLGFVVQVISQGVARFLEVGERGVLIPMNGPFIKSISKSKKRIEVELPEGFLEI